MKALKDWSKDIDGLAEMEDPAVLNLYSEMLATAHDINYTVPDAQLIETEDAAALRSVIPNLHQGIIKAHAEAKSAEKEKSSAKEKASTAKPAPVKKTPTKPARKAVQKESKETTMATTAKKTAKKAPAAKKAAPAKTAKKGAKKAAKANARTPVSGGSRNPFGENAVIKVLNKDTGIRADSERGKRVAVVFKYNGKKVADFYSKEQAPNNRTDTLRFLIDKGFISVK
jgi:outer membrane biosynthesis protein TonB